jgi:hypothetical protein
VSYSFKGLSIGEFSLGFGARLQTEQEIKMKEEQVHEYAAGEQKTVQLTGGANACPPDDCGGIYRYNHLVELMQKKPNSRELREFYDWMGCKWDATFFPLKEAAKAVDRMN